MALVGTKANNFDAFNGAERLDGIQGTSGNFWRTLGALEERVADEHEAELEFFGKFAKIKLCQFVVHRAIGKCCLARNSIEKFSRNFEKNESRLKCS